VCATPPLSTGSCQSGGYSEQVTPAANGANVRVTANGDTSLHAFGASYFVGWSPPGPAPTHLQLTVRTITVRHALAEPNQDNPQAAGLPAVGRYNLYFTSNGRWDFIGGRAPEPNDTTSWVTGLGAVSDGQSFTPNHTVDFFVPTGAPVRLDVSGRECDLPRMDPCLATPEVATGNDHPGHAVVTFPSAAAAVGDHTLASPDGADGKRPSADPNYVMTYNIQEVAGVGNGPSPPGSTGVPSSSPGGNLRGAGTVLQPGGSAQGTPTGRPLSAGCARATPPRSRIHRRRVSHRRRIRLRGTVKAGRCAAVARVQVAVARRVRHGCRFLDRRGHPGPVTACSRPSTFLTARGTRRWRLSLRGRLPRGRYLAVSRATDSQGRLELRRSHGNVAHFHIR
jgi:hypothetical protein